MISLSLWRFCSGSLEGATGRGLLQRNSRRCRARRTVSRLTTRDRSPNNCSTTRREQLQRERNQPCSVGECSSINASIRWLYRLIQKRSSWTSLLAIEKGCLSFSQETLDDRVNGGARAEKNASDPARRVAIGDEHYDVHSQPAAGFAFSRFILRMRLLRSFGARVILCIWAVASLVATGWFGISLRCHRGSATACSIILCTYLGDKKLHKLDAITVQDMYARMQRDGLSPATVNLVHSVLSSAFGRAVKWGVLHHNVIKNVDAPRIVRNEVEIFAPKEVRVLLSAAKYDRLEALYVLALSTGMRGGELLGLEWKHINLEAGTLDVRQTTTIRGQLGTPKSKNSVRTLHLPSIAIEALHKHKKQHSRWLFPNSRGDTIRYHTFVIFHWRPLTERAGIQYRNFHTCRHYVASSLLSKGLPITAVARYLGHDEVTLLRTYSHLIKGMENMVPDAMDSVLADEDTPRLKAP
jgi:integrase